MIPKQEREENNISKSKSYPLRKGEEMRREEVILQKLMAEGEVIKAVEKFIRAGGNPIMIKETVRHTIERMKKQ